MQNIKTNNQRLQAELAKTTLYQTWVNGHKTSTLDANDRGLAYGDGAFTTMLIKNGTIHHWSRHKKRLQETLCRLGIQVSCLIWENIEVVLEQLMRQNHDKGCKLTITRGAGRGYIYDTDHTATWVIHEFPLPNYDNWQENGISLDIHSMFLAHMPLLAGMKHLNRLEQVLLVNKWYKTADDVILCDEFGYMVEASSSNIGFIRDQQLILPTHGKAGVCGIMRYMLMEAWLAWGGEVRVRQVHRQELANFDHILMTNALMGLIPVIRVKEKSYQKLPEHFELQSYIETLSL